MTFLKETFLDSEENLGFLDFKKTGDTFMKEDISEGFLELRTFNYIKTFQDTVDIRGLRLFLYIIYFFLTDDIETGDI